MSLRGSWLRIGLIALILTSTTAVANARPYHFITHVVGKIDYWPRFSPDGKTILFSRCVLSGGTPENPTSGNCDLWTVPKKGGKAAAFIVIDGVSGTRSNWLWTSDPSLTMPIAFTGVPNGPGASHLWLSDATGATTITVNTPSDVGVGYPTWTPDGSAIAVEGQPQGFDGPLLSLVAVPIGNRIAQLTSTDVIWTGQGAISRDGSEIAFAGQLPVSGNQYSDLNNQIWLQTLDPLVLDNLNLHQLDGLQGRTPDWSPNDRFLLFESTRGCLNGNYAIFLEPSSGGKAEQVTDCKLDANHGVWAPDGRHFAFSGVFGGKNPQCANGTCRGIAIAPIPGKILRLGTAN